MRPALLFAVLIVVSGGAFLAGRLTASRRAAPVTVRPRAGSFDAGYRAGREDAFSGYDGGWVLGDPYIVTLRHGGPGITYRFARRWPLLAGYEYWSCNQDIICSRPLR